jgi:predicted secreted Zn-dependent protease
MKKLIALALFLLTACSGSSVPGHPATFESANPSTAVFLPTQVSIEHAQILYYDISGSTASELRASMDSLRPKDPYDGNRPVDAYTGWYISWNWPGYGTENCDLSAAVVTYQINVTLPRWQAPAGASPELIVTWERYIQNLSVHEKGHVNNVVSNYPGILTVIQNATCSTAETAAQKALESLREFDVNYDRETNHGATQGAVFP